MVSKYTGCMNIFWMLYTYANFLSHFSQIWKATSHKGQVLSIFLKLLQQLKKIYLKKYLTRYNTYFELSRITRTSWVSCFPNWLNFWGPGDAKTLIRYLKISLLHHRDFSLSQKIKGSQLRLPSINNLITNINIASPMITSVQSYPFHFHLIKLLS